MRSEREMLDLIIGTAKKDGRIRAVYMNGSRANPNAKKDMFQDYDIVYVVKENRPFYEDETWIHVFGEILFMQCPEQVDRDFGLEVNFDKCFGWLMQFKDGIRLDLRMIPVEEARVIETPCIILLDKDHILPPVPSPSDQNYRIQKPSQKEFSACCNEFWWCLNNVAKGLWREEIPYVQNVYYDGSHPQLVRLLNWKAGYDYGFQISTGKSSKYLKDYLPEGLWNRFLETYINGRLCDIWESVFIMCDIFHTTARELGALLGYTYNMEEAEASLQFAKHICTLPSNAEAIF